MMILMHPAVVSHSCQSHVSSSSSSSNSHAPSLFGSSGFLVLTPPPPPPPPCADVSFRPLLLALLNLTDAELCKSDEFHVVGYFRLLHAGRLKERKQWHLNTLTPTQAEKLVSALLPI